MTRKEDPKYAFLLSDLSGWVSCHPIQVAQAMPTSAFKERASPLHVTVSQTPPTVKEDDDGASSAPVDPGFLGAVVLQPCTFTTGSYGWKGSKRLAIDIVDPTSGEETKVQVMLTYVGFFRTPG